MNGCVSVKPYSLDVFATNTGGVTVRHGPCAFRHTVWPPTRQLVAIRWQLARVLLHNGGV